MKCSKAQRLISASLDGELDEARERAMKAHLSECFTCQSFAADLPRCAAALDRLTAPDVRPGFTARMVARIPESNRVRMWWRDWFDALQPIPVALGALALCFGVLLAILMNGQDDPTDSEPVTPGQSVYAECFDPLPDESVGARYVALVEIGEE
ncbi:MAG: zf-HC2 domain-containing protein [Pirellulaceae bacterium]